MTFQIISGHSAHCTRCTKKGIPYQYGWVVVKETGEVLCDLHLATPRPSQWTADGRRVYEYVGEIKQEAP